MELTPNQKHAVKTAVRLRSELKDAQERLKAMQAKCDETLRQGIEARTVLILEFGSPTEKRVFKLDGLVYLFDPAGGSTSDVIRVVELHEVK